MQNHSAVEDIIMVDVSEEQEDSDCDEIIHEDDEREEGGEQLQSQLVSFFSDDDFHRCMQEKMEAAAGVVTAVPIVNGYLKQVYCHDISPLQLVIPQHVQSGY